jgi:uncharacterized protein (DUF433 family)
MAKTTKERKVIRTEHPHIIRVQGVCGGLEIVEGRRVPVWAIANYWQMGMKAEEIAEELSLPLSHVFDALSYYLDHQADIDRQIEESQKLPEGFYVDERGFVRRVEEKSR